MAVRGPFTTSVYKFASEEGLEWCGGGSGERAGGGIAAVQPEKGWKAAVAQGSRAN